ncbi:unnamed protein product [Clavelina lepadiformis]|uniref:Uncharacterized protein n=1 Tax=Clavelina lepadiformis TaxID=159417 RepID=A0ABP0FZG3_CLALP
MVGYRVYNRPHQRSSVMWTLLQRNIIYEQRTGSNPHCATGGEPDVTEQVYAASRARFDVGWFLCNNILSNIDARSNVDLLCMSRSFDEHAWVDDL